MATFARCAPLEEPFRALVADPQFAEILHRSRSLLQKVLNSIPVTHKSCVHTEQDLKLNSSENAKFEIMASTIGIPDAPELKVVSASFPLETSLRQMVEGLQLFRSLLISISPHFGNNSNLSELTFDIRDLLLQINKMLKMVKTEAVAEPTPASITLRLPGEYEVQVAGHLILVQLQAFGQDMSRSLRSLSDDDDN